MPKTSQRSFSDVLVEGLRDKWFYWGSTSDPATYIKVVAVKSSHVLYYEFSEHEGQMKRFNQEAKEFFGMCLTLVEDKEVIKKCKKAEVKMLLQT